MEIVARQLRKETVVAAHARAACSTASDDLVSFLRGSPNARDVVSKIDRNIWESEQLGRPQRQPNALFALFQELGRLNRNELKSAPALAWVRNPIQADGKILDVGLHQLGTALMLARAEERETTARFLKAVVKREWLQEQFAGNASTGTIAATLYTLWGYLEKEVRSYFDIRELRIRVEREVANLRSKDAKALFEAIQLLGCAVLFGLIIDCEIQGPSNHQIGSAFREQKFRNEREDIGNIEVQFWLGLREMARRRGPYWYKVPVAEGEKALVMWKKAKGPTPRHESLNALMTEWLERCSKAGWYLEPGLERPRRGATP